MATRTEKTIKRLRIGDLLAEVDVELRFDDDKDYSPVLTTEDALRVERVSRALNRGDVAAASKEARVYRLTPVGAA